MLEQMKRTYVYENGIVYITIPENNSRTIINATERFLKRIAFEKGQIRNGNNHTSRYFREEQILRR